jgi:hypothetical protein
MDLGTSFSLLNSRTTLLKDVRIAIVGEDHGTDDVATLAMTACAAKNLDDKYAIVTGPRIG